MEKCPARFSVSLSGVLSGLALATAILLATTFGARAVLHSALYSKSRLISMLVSQNSISISGLVQDRRNIDMLLQFVGALTSAYINFELIPVNEVGTFAVVFESVPEEAEVERFQYRRKNLAIFGTAATLESYELFLANLRESGYFQDVIGSQYTTMDNRIRFELECVSQSASVFLDFGAE